MEHATNNFYAVHHDDDGNSYVPETPVHLMPKSPNEAKEELRQNVNAVRAMEGTLTDIKFNLPETTWEAPWNTFVLPDEAPDTTADPAYMAWLHHLEEEIELPSPPVLRRRAHEINYFESPYNSLLESPAPKRSKRTVPGDSYDNPIVLEETGTEEDPIIIN